MAASSKERQAALVARKKAQGLKQIRNLWSYPEDEPAVKEFTATKVEMRRLAQEKKKR